MFLNGRTILGLPRKIGNANIKTATERLRFSFYPNADSGGKCPPDTFFARRRRHFLRCAPVAILGLPRKVDNANTQP